MATRSQVQIVVADAAPAVKVEKMILKIKLKKFSSTHCIACRYRYFCQKDNLNMKKTQYCMVVHLDMPHWGREWRERVNQLCQGRVK